MVAVQTSPVSRPLLLRVYLHDPHTRDSWSISSGPFAVIVEYSDAFGVHLQECEFDSERVALTNTECVPEWLLEDVFAVAADAVMGSIRDSRFAGWVQRGSDVMRRLSAQDFECEEPTQPVPVETMAELIHRERLERELMQAATTRRLVANENGEVV